MSYSQKRKWSQDHIKQEPFESPDRTNDRVVVQKPQVNIGQHASHSPQKDMKMCNRPPATSVSSPHQLMHETVSSSQDARIKSGETSPYPGSSGPYPVSLTRVKQNILESGNYTNPTVLLDRTSPFNKNNMSTVISKVQNKTQSMNSDGVEKSPSAQSYQVLQDIKTDTPSGDSSTSFNLSPVTSSISRFSAEELLAKKGIRGRPTEAQRLGTVLIRNSAQSIKIWDAPPQMKDISDAERNAFMKYIVTSAPQLAGYIDLVWTRLREALQNRRKYLLDKEIGRRILKGSSMPDSDHGILNSAIQRTERNPVKSEPTSNNFIHVTSKSYSDNMIDLT